MRKLWSLFGLSLAAALAPVPAHADTAAQQGALLLKQFNVYTLQNLNSTSHVQGKVWVGGNLTGDLIAAQGGSGPMTASSYAELTVGDNASAKIKVEQSLTSTRTGSLVQIGKNSTGEVGLNGAGGHVDTGGTFNTTNFNPSPTKTYTANVAGLGSQIALNTTDFSNNLQALSTALAALPSVAITDPSASLTVGGDYGVFTMTKAQFEKQNYNFDTLFTGVASTKTVIINVVGSGGFTEDNGANNNLSGTQASNVIWNFTDASAVSVKNWGGSILATKATVTNSSTITGSVVAKIFNQNGEVHLGTFNGTTRYLVTSEGPPAGGVPEPASWVTMLAGFGLIGFVIRRRRGMLATA